jgi:Amt family ammonium transporter
MEQEKLKIDDVLGVWPLHGICGTWGGIAAGIFGYKELGGMGGVSFVSQLLGSIAAVVFALVCSYIVYTLLAKTVGIRSGRGNLLKCQQKIITARYYYTFQVHEK